MHLQIKSPLKTRRRRRSSDRRGGAAVEAALIFPFIIIIMMGTLEMCSGLYLKESLTVAAFEGVRMGIRRRGTPEQVLERAYEVLDERGIVYDPNEVTVTPDDFGSLQALDPIRVDITVPVSPNSIFIFGHLSGRDVRASVTMVREFDD